RFTTRSGRAFPLSAPRAPFLDDKTRGAFAPRHARSGPSRQTQADQRIELSNRAGCSAAKHATVTTMACPVVLLISPPVLYARSWWGGRVASKPHLHSLSGFIRDIAEVR